MTQFTVGSSLFAVTDHYVVFEIKITHNNEISSGDSEDQLRRLRTEIVENEKYQERPDYLDSQHKAYFSRIYLRNGVLDSSVIFDNKSEAVHQAINFLREKKEMLNRELANLSSKEAKLISEIETGE